MKTQAPRHSCEGLPWSDYVKHEDLPWRWVAPSGGSRDKRQRRRKLGFACLPPLLLASPLFLSLWHSFTNNLFCLLILTEDQQAGLQESPRHSGSGWDGTDIQSRGWYSFYQFCFFGKPWLKSGTRNTQWENGLQKNVCEKLDFNMKRYDIEPWSHNIIWCQQPIKNGLQTYMQNLKLENSWEKVKEVPELALTMTKNIGKKVKTKRNWLQ